MYNNQDLKVKGKAYSPFPRYFKRKVDRETLAPERGYGKYTSNMADDEWLQVHAHKDELQRWQCYHPCVKIAFTELGFQL